MPTPAQQGLCGKEFEGFPVLELWNFFTTVMSAQPDSDDWRGKSDLLQDPCNGHHGDGIPAGLRVPPDESDQTKVGQDGVVPEAGD